MKSFCLQSIQTWQLRLRACLQSVLIYQTKREQRGLLTDAQAHLWLSLYHLCCQARIINKICESLTLQDRLLHVLSYLPLPARLRFLEALVHQAPALIATLMVDRAKELSLQACFVQQSLQQLSALTQLVEILGIEHWPLIQQMTQNTPNDTAIS